MNISTLSLRDLEYVVAVAERMHFGRAAEAVHVSQPALSAQIRKVEELLGVTLFERASRRVSITPAGQGIVAQARRVLEEARKILELARGQDQPLAGALRLGAIASLGPYYVPYFLAPLRKEYPRLNLVLQEGLTEQLVEELRAGTLDAVLASPTFKDPSLRELPLFFEPFLLAAPKGHPLAARRPLRTSDLRPDEMVLLSDGHCLRDQTLNLCPTARRGQPPRHNVQATSLETLRHLVASGHGYTLVPLLATRSDPGLKDLLRYRRFDAGDPGRVISLYCRSTHPRIRDMELLAGLLKENAPPGTRPPEQGRD